MAHLVPDRASRDDRAWSVTTTAFLSVAVFAVLATANTGGYRYGIGDQAFYIPDILHQLSPSLFPRDVAVFGPQAKLLLADRVAAAFTRATSASLPALFLGLQVATMVVMALGAFAVGRAFYRSTWTALALTVALTFRHRIAKTGVNTLEGYFHPRMLAFALGVAAVAAFAHRRRGWAAVGLALAACAHPTTGAIFVVWVACAALIIDGLSTPVLVAALVGAACAVGVVWLGPFGTLVVTMDEAWTRAFAAKDYIFPTAWTWRVWAMNAVAPILVALVVARRRQLDLASDEERSLALACGALGAGFLASLPFVAARVALVVQLQVSRVLWPIDFLATASLVWCLVEAPSGGPWLPPRWRGPIVVVALGLASLGRGAYVMAVEHQRALVTPGLAATPWQTVADWARIHTPPDAHFLVDPNHAVTYGVSFRVAGERDVFLESVKDDAMALYSRDVALRVAERALALGDYETLTVARAHALADAYALDYLIDERDLALPLVHATGAFNVYALNPESAGRVR
ncbi:MAG: hypothetical protein U0Q12_12630 [Vicinamibacterales bacterium]